MSAKGKAFEELVGPLVGATITGTATDTEEEFFALVLEKDGKKVFVWVLRDPEGNGPGWLDVDFWAK